MKIIWLLIVIFTCASPGFAQKRSWWKELLPTDASVQFAGNTGFLSAGLGYHTADQRLRGTLFYGFVPRSLSDETIHSISAKLEWSAIQTSTKNLRLQLLNAGLFGNYAFGKQFFAFDPDNYPYKYYGFPSAINTGIYIGQGLSYRKFTLYYDLNSTAKELISFFGNTKTLRPDDVLSLGIGLRLQVR